MVEQISSEMIGWRLTDERPEGDTRQRPGHTPTTKSGQTHQKREEALWKFWREEVLRSGREWKFSKAELCAQCKLLNAKLLSASKPCPHWTHLGPIRQHTQKMTNLFKSGPSGPVLSKIGAIFAVFWRFGKNIHIVASSEPNCFIQAFAVQCCPFRHYSLFVALTLPKIG